MTELIVRLRELHAEQRAIRDSQAKRKVVRAGRRGGKTVVAAYIAVKQFLDGHRVLYAVPTQEQVDRFWFEVKRALAEPLDAGAFYKNETKHIIERSGTEQRIRAKTAWDADSLRGDYADYLIMDEYQLMKPSKEDPTISEAWGLVGAPMLLDNDGDALFIYTGKRGRNHAKHLFAKAVADTTGRWETFTFSSHDNPHISRQALEDITGDMTNLSYRLEILAEDLADDPNALWTRGIIQYVTKFPDLSRVVVGVDPPGGATECGIVAAGRAMVDGQWIAYVLDDRSLKDTPAKWGAEAVATYNRHKADRVLGEKNYGGDMVKHTIRSADGGADVSFSYVTATRGKAVRAEPIVAMYEQGRVLHVGEFPELEDEYCNWIPGIGSSPNRLDAAVWALTDLLLLKTKIKTASSWQGY